MVGIVTLFFTAQAWNPQILLPLDIGKQKRYPAAGTGPEAIAMAGPGLKEICGSLGIPPVLHIASCVDNARILQLAALFANALGVNFSDLPLAGSSPEWYLEKAAAIGTYCVASGIYTHLGHPPKITSSEMVTNLALEGLDKLLGVCFGIVPDPFKVAELINKRIRQKCKVLGLGE